MRRKCLCSLSHNQLDTRQVVQCRVADSQPIRGDHSTELNKALVDMKRELDFTKSRLMFTAVETKVLLAHIDRMVLENVQLDTTLKRMTVVASHWHRVRSNS